MTDTDADAVALLREQLDRLHLRNEELVSELRSRADDPLVRDLLSLADAAARNARTWTDRLTADPADVSEALTGVAEDVHIILDRFGVESFAPQPGEMFDRRTARVARLESTPEPEQVGRVAAVLRCGYRSGDRVIRYPEVMVLKANGASDDPLDTGRSTRAAASSPPPAG